MKKHKIEIDIEPDGIGCTIWVDDTWILDASTFKRDNGLITLDLDRLKEINNDGSIITFKMKTKKERKKRNS